MSKSKLNLSDIQQIFGGIVLLVLITFGDNILMWLS